MSRPPEPPLRVVFVTNIPSPYQVDFFTALAGSPEIEPHVFFCAATERDRQFSIPAGLPFSAEILSGQRYRWAPKDWHRSPALPGALSEREFDAAVVGGSYFMPAARTARRFFHRHQMPWVYWGENPRKKRSAGARQWTKDRYLQWFLHGAAGVLGIGELACDAYREVLQDGRPVLNVPYAPDLEPLLDPTAKLLDQARYTRESWPMDDPVVILFAGSLTERKAPDQLLEAFGRIARDQPRLCLALAGAGPLEQQLTDATARAGLAGRVKLLGHVEGNTLHAAYLSSDLLVLPTRTHEGWGVVVAEALAAGLPVIASDRVGAAHDLVQTGVTGWTFPHGNVDALAESLMLATVDSAKLHSMSTACRRTATSVDSRHVAARLARSMGTIFGLHRL